MPEASEIVSKARASWRAIRPRSRTRASISSAIRTPTRSTPFPQQQLATQQATVEQDVGTVKLDQGNLAAAQVNVDYTRIVAPIDGRVGLRNIDPGNIVPANGTAGSVRHHPAPTDHGDFHHRRG